MRFFGALQNKRVQQNSDDSKNQNHDCSTVFVITLFGYLNRYEGLNYFVVSVVRNQPTSNVVFLSPLNL